MNDKTEWGHVNNPENQNVQGTIYAVCGNIEKLIKQLTTESQQNEKKSH
jgi:hypothetical protein